MGFEPLGEVAGHHKVCEVFAQLVMGLIIEALDCCFPDCPVHAFELTVCPGMLGLGCPVIDVVPSARVRVRPEAFAVGHGFFDQRDG